MRGARVQLDACQAGQNSVKDDACICVRRTCFRHCSSLSACLLQLCCVCCVFQKHAGLLSVSQGVRGVALSSGRGNTMDISVATSLVLSEGWGAWWCWLLAAQSAIS